MKKKIIVLSLLIMTFAGCNAAGHTKIPPGQNIKRLEYSSRTGSRISIVNSPALIKQGYSGYLSIKAMPGISYTVTAAYKDGNNILTAHQSKTADSNGLVSWSWRVSRTTEPGSYPLVISGGGDTCTTTYTVTR